MFDLGRKKCLVLDCTNWKIGSTDVNILMLAIVTRRFRVPLLWSLIDHQGSSDADQCIALMRRCLGSEQELLKIVRGTTVAHTHAVCSGRWLPQLKSSSP